MNQRYIRRRTRSGVEEFRCKTCGEWKPRADFPPRPTKYTPAGIHGSCRLCYRKKQIAYNEKNAEPLREGRKRQYERDYEMRRRADENQKHGRHLPRFPRFVEREKILPFLDTLMTEYDNDSGMAAGAAETSSRTLYAIRYGERPTVRFDLAERIAIAASMHSQFLDLFPLGVEGWNRAGDRYCRHCGRSDIRHGARGFCLRCYQTAHYYESRGGKMRQPHTERWMRTDEFMGCLRCKTMEREHRSFGLCQRCFDAVTRRNPVPDAPLYRKHIERRRAAIDASRARATRGITLPADTTTPAADTE